MYMEVSLFLKEDFAEAFHREAIPHVGEHAKTYLEMAQCIAMIDEIMETPHFQLCLQQLEAIDPGNNIDITEELGFFEMDTELSPYAAHLKELYEMIEKEKRKVIRAFRTKADFMIQVKKRIKRFYEKKDKLCTATLHQLEYIIEKRRLDKIKTSLPSSSP